MTLAKWMLATSLATVTSLAAPVSLADTERQVAYRQAVYKVVGGQMGVLAGMARGTRDYNQADAQLAADTIAQLSLVAPSVFAPESIAMHGSEALEAINEDREAFNELMDNFQARSADLAAALNDAEEFPRAAFGQMAQTCKGCHDQFKAD